MEYLMDHKLSIIIPVYNEEKTVVQLLDKVKESKLSISKELIIINDGSTDNSGILINEWYKKNPSQDGFDVQYIEKQNGGKGSAVREGIEHSTGSVLIIQDADLEYDPNDYQVCIDPILNGVARVVYGSRELKSNVKRVYSSPFFFLGGLLLSNWMNLLYGSNLTDEPTCYKCFDGELIRNIPFKGNKFEWEPEITAKLLRLGMKIYEVPISYYPRRINEGKKITWNDGLVALWIALIWRFASIKDLKTKLSENNKLSSMFPHIQKIKIALFIIVSLAFIVCMIVVAPAINSVENKLTSQIHINYIQPVSSFLRFIYGRA
jgi:glycosyltransferase involved in cell wall biosynthesis